eukprot:4969967-Alexandrium_andersonii.AAC.1
MLLRVKVAALDVSTARHFGSVHGKVPSVYSAIHSGPANAATQRAPQPALPNMRHLSCATFGVAQH